MAKTKIMHFIHGLNTGGAETLVKNYMLYFDRKKLDVVLLCLKHERKSPYEKKLEDNGVRVIYVEDYLPFKKGLNTLKKAINRFCEYSIVRREIRKESPDVLHTHLPINAFVKYTKPKRGTIIFHTVHNEPKILWTESKKDRIRDFKAAKWLVRKYGMKFVVLHDKMRKEVNKMFGVSNTIVLNNGIELEKFRGLRDKNNIRKWFGIPASAFVIGHIGRFSEQKNHRFLVNVFLEIKKKKKDAFLLMIGDGSEKERIIEKLDMVGLKDDYLILSNRDDVADLMSIMDVFVFPSRYEGLGIVLIEAQESRLPCFVSDKIPKHADISNLMTRLSLDSGAKNWADVVLSYKRPRNIVVNDMNWDIRKITKQLEREYEMSLLDKKTE